MGPLHCVPSSHQMMFTGFQGRGPSVLKYILVLTQLDLAREKPVVSGLGAHFNAVSVHDV